MARGWILSGQTGVDECMKYDENVPEPDTLAPNEVLVELYAATLNYRELAIADAGVSSFHIKGGRGGRHLIERERKRG